MSDNNTTNCLNGELKPGDLVLSTPVDDFSCLVGTVLEITKAGTPAHEAETGNPTDGVHVNFKDAEYSSCRITEIEEMLSVLYNQPISFEESSLDDVIMEPGSLFRVTGICGPIKDLILDSREGAESFCKTAEHLYSPAHKAEKSAPVEYITEKLYSPIFCKIEADENSDHYGGDYWNDPLSQREAAMYEDEIHAAILRERMPDEAERGLMEYYHGGGAVDEKVRSLFVDVEVHDDKLWGVATLELTENLTREELTKLKEYLSGQYSDGFGEGFEQRGFRVDGGELYVSLWESGDVFFIDTSLEFERRLGLEAPLVDRAAAPAIPASTTVSVPDICDNQETADLRIRLIERLDSNLKSYLEAAVNSLDYDAVSMSNEIAAYAGAHYYMTAIHDFSAAESRYLLKFSDPLAVAGDKFHMAGMDDCSDIMWDIFDRQDALQGGYELISVHDINGDKIKPVPDEKPSVLEQIRKAAKAPKAPRKVTPVRRRKDRPER